MYIHIGTDYKFETSPDLWVVADNCHVWFDLKITSALPVVSPDVYWS